MFQYYKKKSVRNCQSFLTLTCSKAKVHYSEHKKNTSDKLYHFTTLYRRHYTTLYQHNF